MLRPRPLSPVRHRFPPSRLLLLALVAVFAPLAGCSRPATSPIESSAAMAHGDLAFNASLPGELDAEWFGPDGVVDLRDGRVTEVENRFSVTFISPSEPPIPPFSVVETIRYTVEGTQDIDGVRYVLEQEMLEGGPGLESLFRQDRSGLYLWQEDASWPLRDELAAAREGRIEDAVEAVISVAAKGDAGRAAALEAAWAGIRARRQAVAASLGLAAAGDLPIVQGGGPPGGAGTHEITMLRYPLRPGATWDGRVGFNIWTVEALETVLTPAGRLKAARLNIDLPDFFGPDDRYVTWWGAPGELKREFTSVGTATDPNGNEIGTFSAVESRTLTVYEPGVNP